MRTRALKEIKKLGHDGLQARLQQIRQFNNKPVEEQNEIISTLSGMLKEAGVTCNAVEDKVRAAHDKYIAILGAEEVPDNLR